MTKKLLRKVEGKDHDRQPAYSRKKRELEDLHGDATARYKVRGRLFFGDGEGNWVEVVNNKRGA